jgi:hypothetical protein
MQRFGSIKQRYKTYGISSSLPKAPLYPEMAIYRSVEKDTKH